MKKIMQGLLAATLLLSLAAFAAQADPTTATSIGVGMSGRTVLDFHTMGFGANVNIPFREGRWAANADARYELSNYKEEDSSGPTTDTFEQKFTGYQIRAGIDRQVEVGPAVFYCGPGLSYSSHKIKTMQTGFGDVESEPYSVFGINSRLGSAVPLSSNDNLQLFGQFEHTLGWGSYEENNFKVTQTDVSVGYQMGLRYAFPQN